MSMYHFIRSLKYHLHDQAVYLLFIMQWLWCVVGGM